MTASPDHRARTTVLPARTGVASEPVAGRCRAGHASSCRTGDRRRDEHRTVLLRAPGVEPGVPSLSNSLQWGASQVRGAAAREPGARGDAVAASTRRSACRGPRRARRPDPAPRSPAPERDRGSRRARRTRCPGRRTRRRCRHGARPPRSPGERPAASSPRRHRPPAGEAGTAPARGAPPSRPRSIAGRGRPRARATRRPARPPPPGRARRRYRARSDPGLGRPSGRLAASLPPDYADAATGCHCTALDRFPQLLWYRSQDRGSGP